MQISNFLQGITWKDGVWAALAAILIFLNVRSCNSSKDLLQVSSSSCDTIEIIQIDSFIEWKIAEIPEPVVDTIEIMTFVERIVKVIVSDTVKLTEFVPTYISIIDSVPLYVYDSLFETKDYKLRWHIEALGELKAFHHALNFKYEVRQTNNLIQAQNKRNWHLTAGTIFEVDFAAPSRTAVYLGADLNRFLGKNNAVSLGAGYYNRVSDQIKWHLFKLNAGIRF